MGAGPIVHPAARRRRRRPQRCVNSRGGYFAYVIPTNQRAVDAVFYPESEADVVKVVELAKTVGFTLIPRGGGTNVSNMLEVPRSEKRQVVSVDMMRMHKLIDIDDINLTATIEAGANGPSANPRATGGGHKDGSDRHGAASVALWRPHCEAAIGPQRPIPY